MSRYIKSSTYGRYVLLCFICEKEELNPLSYSGDNLTDPSRSPPYCHSCKKKLQAKFQGKLGVNPQ